MLTNRIPLSEYHARWKKVQSLGKAHGLDAMVIWSRGGGPVDTAEDLIWLANWCSPSPFVPDVPGNWSGLSSSAIIIPVNAEPVLVTDYGLVRRDVVPVEDVRSSGMVPDLVNTVLSELNAKRVGLVAGNALLVSPYQRLLETARDREFVSMDVAFSQLKTIKSPLEFQLLREAAQIGNQAMLEMMRAALKPGTTEAEAVAAAYRYAVANGTAVIDAAVASGPNSHFYAWGQAPQWTTRALQSGDLFHCDMYGAATEGYRYDFSRTVVCGGRPSSEQEALIDGAIAAVNAGIAAVKPGEKASSIWYAVQGELDRRGISVGYGVAGHSYGLGWEAPWLIASDDTIIQPGMALAIETMAGTKELGSVKFEQNILVHAGYNELLTTCPEKPWL